MPDDEITDQVLILHEMNEVRCRSLESKTGGQTSLENSFDALRILIFIEHIAVAVGIVAEAELDFEGRRSEMLTKIENEYEKMLAAKEAAERQAKLAGGPVWVPNRFHRRHPG